MNLIFFRSRFVLYSDKYGMYELEIAVLCG